MHLRTMKIFCEVAARRSFSQAARAQQVSQSMASQAVHSLEARLGVQLIDRSKRPLELTDAGRTYLSGCRSLLEGFQETEERVRRLANKVEGRLRIAGIYSAGLLQMDEYLRCFRQTYPDVQIRLDYLRPEEIYERLRADDVELGLVSFPQGGNDFSTIPWQEQRMVLVTAWTHPLAGRNSVSCHELNGIRFVAFTEELSIRKRMNRWLRQAKLNVDIVQQFDNIETMKRAIEIESGVSVLPEATVAREVEIRTLAAIPFNDVEWFRPLGIVHRRHRLLSAAADHFIELLHDREASKATVPRLTTSNGRRPGQAARLADQDQRTSHS